MHSLNLKHSNWFFFSSSQIVQYFVSRQGELEQGAVFTCRMYTFCISTLCTRRRWLKKRRRLVQMQCTTTSWGKQTHFAQWYVHFVQPNPETWMLSGSQEQNRLFHTVEQGAKFLVDDLFFFFSPSCFWIQIPNIGPGTWRRMTVLFPTRTEKNSALVKLKNQPQILMLNTCVMHGMHELVMVQRRLFGKYTDPSNHCTNSTRAYLTGL